MLPRVRPMLRAACCVLLLLPPAVARAQDKALTIDVLYDPDHRVSFSGAPPTDLSWIDDAHYVWGKRTSTGRGREWVAVDAATGTTAPLFDTAKLEAAIAALSGLSRDTAAALAAGGLIFNRAKTAALIDVQDDLYYYDFASGRVARLTDTPGEEEEATFSPDGKTVAFVRRNNLFVVDVESRRERALTKDGGDQILNGKLDWLYQEEIYGRGFFRAYWWSPDSSRVAFLRLDEHPVPEFPVVDTIPTRPVIEHTEYPRAGEPNPTVRLGVAKARGGDTEWVDLSVYKSSDFLIVNAGWTPDGRRLLYQVQNREQTWLDLNTADEKGRDPKTVLRETTKAWVNENGNPVWLKDGTFLWMSERSGFKHVYHYRADGTLVRQVTSGRWEVRSLYGADPAGWVYFAGTERSPIGQDVYRIRLDGTGLTRLSRAEGRHRALFNPGFSQYIGYWSDINTPTQVRLHRADGSEARVIDANVVAAITEYGLTRPEFLQVKTRDGFVMEAMMIKPRNFDPSRRYPVFQDTYAGPGAQSVVNAWQGQPAMFWQLLAQQGVIVWLCDNRSASGKGVESQWPIYQRLGELELQDIEDGIAWLKTQPYVDGSRILLSGWSYGGFMTSYALTHSTSFAAGIVGAPVTDWRNYDSVYTERYMKTPQNNPDGYQRTAPARAAASLHGKALIIHGTTDDNVHMQNTEQLAYELQRADKPFEVMIYPRSRHGITDPRLDRHLHQLMLDFVMRTVGSKTAAVEGRGSEPQ